MCFFSKPEVVYVPQEPVAAPATPTNDTATTTPAADNNTTTTTATGSNNTTTATTPVELPPAAPPAQPPVLANQPTFYGGGGGGSVNQVMANNPVMQNVYDPSNPEAGVNREKGSTLKKARGTSQLRVDLDPVIATMAKQTGLQINK